MRNLAKRFKVTKNFVDKLLQRFKKTAQIAPKPHGGGRSPSITAVGETFIKEIIFHQPDLTLFKILDEYNEHFESVSLKRLIEL